MSGIATLLSSDLPSKRIVLFDGCPELLYLAYLKEIIAHLRKTDTLLVEHLRSKECSHSLLFEKLHSISCFERMFFTYDDPNFSISEVGKVENYLCLYSQEGFRNPPKRSDLIRISSSQAMLEDLIVYYSDKYSLDLESEAVKFLLQYFKKNAFAIDEEMSKFKYCFGGARITVDDVSKLCEPASPSVNSFCRAVITLEASSLGDSFNHFPDGEIMLVIRCLMKYCDAVIDITSGVTCGVPRSEIVQHLRKKQFYDLKMIDQVLENPSCLNRARTILLELPKIEEQYKLSARKTFSLPLASLMEILLQTE